jgi:hypothetical protein
MKLFIGVAFAAATWAQSPVLPIKGALQMQAAANPDNKSNGAVSVVLRLYDREFGGTLLFEERQVVQVDSGSGIFVALVGNATRGGVPARITDQHSTLWGEYVVASAAFINTVQTRQQITHRVSGGIGTDVTFFVNVSDALCYSCGGAWPIFSGSWNVPYSTNNVTERGSLCGGTPIARTDTRPYLCSRTAQ